MKDWRAYRDEHADDVLWAPPSFFPFAGVTMAKAELMNSALRGYPVRVRTRNDDAQNRPATVGIFGHVRLPGDWARTPFECVGDVIVYGGPTLKTVFEDGRCCTGSSRVMGLGAITYFEVLAADAWLQCDQCMCFRPREQLTFMWRWTEDWTEDDLACNSTYDLVCKGHSWETGYCS